MVDLAADGLTDKAIAAATGLSIATVRTYWERIRVKTGATTRTHAVCIALGLREKKRVRG